MPRGGGAGQQAVPQQVPLQLRQVGVGHRHEGHLQERQSGDPGVLQEGLPRERHHQYRGEQSLRQDQCLVQARPEEVPDRHPAVGQAIQMSW